MRHITRVLLVLCLFVLAVPSQQAWGVGISGSTCPPDGCPIYLPVIVKPGVHLKIGLVADTGGIADMGFNQAAWQAVLDAEENLGTSGAYLESKSQSDYTRHINSFISQGYDLIITVGFAMGNATMTAAQGHTSQKFTIVDVAFDPVISNVIGQDFAMEQVAFLCGYLAAGMTKAGKVATFGGMNIPPVTRFMNGYYQGVVYYNLENGKTIQVLGWNPITKTGEFTNDFTSEVAGLDMGNKLLDQGADIIFPVAGVTGLGAAQAVQARPNSWLIGVDTDWTMTAPEYKDVVLTSALKNIRAATYGVINLAYKNSFTGGTYVGTLANEGVGLGVIASGVPPSLVTEVNQVKTGIILGTIHVTP